LINFSKNQKGMSDCQVCHSLPIEIICPQCDESTCYHCATSKHVRDEALQQHKMNYICEECEEEVSTVFCQNCEQNLCGACDKTIHNKGKRAQHVRGEPEALMNLRDIKVLVYLSIPFLQANFDVKDKEKFEEQIKLLESQTLKVDSNSRILVTITDPDFVQDQNGIENFLKSLKLKNYFYFDAKDCENLKKSKPPSFHLAALEDKPTHQYLVASTLYYITKCFPKPDSIYVFDEYHDDSLIKILKNIEGFGSYQFYHSDNISKISEYSGFNENEPTATSSRIEEAQSTPFQSKSLQPKFSHSYSEARKDDVFDPFATKPKRSESFLDELEGSKPESSYWDYMFMPKDQLIKHSQSFDELILQGADDSFQRNPTITYKPSKFSQRRVPLQPNQQYKNVEVFGSLKISHFLQREMMKYADRGELLISTEEFSLMYGATFYNKFQKDLNETIQKAEEAKLIHITTRKFLDKDPMHFIGLLLDEITIESLSWAIKSIKIDLMTPTEKLILSRIKECYGLKIEQTRWKEILDYIMLTQKDKAFPLETEKVLDPATQVETYVIYIKGDEWVPEDQGYVNLQSEEWKAFIKFMDDFYKDEEQKAPTQELPKKSTFWSSSVENVLNRKKEGAGSAPEEAKAIPGGRYGCAQFVKSCGPEILRRLSIGKLTLFVQEAINKGLLKYERTLLVKNHPNESILHALTDGNFNVNYAQDPALAKKTKLVKRIKDIILNIIGENREGVSLAQIPLLLRRKLGFSVNFQDLGFPKLKNFITTAMADMVKIESSGANHSFAVLKEPLKKKPSMMPSQATQPMLPKQYPKAFQPQKFNTLAPSEVRSAEPVQKINRKRVSTVDDFLIKLKDLIDTILKENPYGVSVQKLQQLVGAKLGFEFDPRVFNTNNMYEFLLNYMEDSIDIEIKRNMTLIYPKNQRFGPQNLLSMYNSTLPGTPHPNENIFNNYSNPFQLESSEIEAPPGLHSLSLKGCHSGPVGVSPILFYGGEDEFEGESRHEDKSSTRKVSFFNIDFGNDIPSVNTSNLNEGEHSRKGSKFSFAPLEDSNVEIKDNLQFIENLLRDNQEDTSLMASFTQEKNEPSDHDIVLNLPEISTIHAGGVHSKNQSDDFTSKTEWTHPLGRGHHGNNQHSNSNNQFRKVK